jgi:hypothetical protein
VRPGDIHFLTLSWTGDATKSDVSAIGALTLPGDGGALQTWCVDSESTIQLSGKSGTRLLVVGKDPGLVAEPNDRSCHQPSDGGTPPPLPSLQQYDACITLP